MCLGCLAQTDMMALCCLKHWFQSEVNLGSWSGSMIHYSQQSWGEGPLLCASTAGRALIHLYKLIFSPMFVFPV